MVRNALAWLCLMVMLAGCTKGYRAEQTVGDLRVVLAADRYPLDLGDNALTVELSDRSGSSIPGAAIRVRCLLPPMPGMGATRQEARVVPQEGRWLVLADFHTVGRWSVEVEVERPGRSPVTVAFSL